MSSKPPTPPLTRRQAEQRTSSAVNPLIWLPKVQGAAEPLLASTLAREVVMYGDDLQVVADAHGCTVEVLAHLVSSSTVLQREIAGVRKELVGLDRVQMRARDIVEADMGLLAEIIRSTSEPATVRLRAYEMAAQVAGALVKGGGTKDPKGGGGGGAVNILIAGNVTPPSVAGSRVIDGETAQALMKAKSGDVEDDTLDEEDALAAAFMERQAREEHQRETVIPEFEEDGP